MENDIQINGEKFLLRNLRQKAVTFSGVVVQGRQQQENSTSQGLETLVTLLVQSSVENCLSSSSSFRPFSLRKIHKSSECKIPKATV